MAEEEEINEKVDETQEDVVDEQIAQEETAETEEEEVPEVELTVEEKLTNEVAEFKDKYLRLYSEFENFRKRTAREKADLITTASEGMIREVLPTVDDFERAIAANEESEDVKVLKEGFTLIYDKLYKMLENKGLTPINAKGEVFDTELHEAVTQFPAPSEDMKGKVIDEVEKGYLLGEKVVRFSKVVIGQ